jgi:hypothetical protein
MRILIAVALSLALTLSLTGCSSKVDDSPQKMTMPADNNAPQAKNAPAAPRETDTPTPGEMMKKGRRGN